MKFKLCMVLGLNLGIRQCGEGIDEVELPPWAADARLFTLLHRQALEAAHVSETLPHWIDLVFGHKQTGPAALDAINVFPACVTIALLTSIRSLIHCKYIVLRVTTIQNEFYFGDFSNDD